MKLTDQELKDNLKENFEAPSYGFNIKTMRNIEENIKQNDVFVPLQVSRWIISTIISAFLLCFISASIVDSLSLTYLLPAEYLSKVSVPEVSIFWMWGLAFLGLAIGLWAWIILFQTQKIKL
jgi:hypothetical protein